MIVVTAATPWEYLPLISALDLPAARGRTRGSVGGRELLLVETGMGTGPARAALEALGSEPVELAVSSGFAGALQPGVAPGELAFDPHRSPVAFVEAARRAASAAGVPLHLGRVVSSEEVCGPAAKRALGAGRRALAVDMESDAVRAWAAARGAEALTMRIVLDAMDEGLPRGTPAGESLRALGRYAVAHAAELPWLARLWWRQRSGMRVLGKVLGRFLEEIDS